ncbi:MAG: HAMP domain-containing sensor histidine kinase [Planctomycetota bacterium]|nr:HAMP domain-containing sensor histidine kinase [Planctomycetota bacterium]
MFTRSSRAQSVGEEAPRGGREALLGQLRHEFKNSMHVIIGLAEALQLEVCGPLTEKQSASMQAIEDSGRTLFARLEGFMDLLRLESGEPEFECEHIAVSRCCQEAMQRVQSRHPGDQRKLSLVVDRQPNVEADPALFAQLLDQLLGAAWEATGHCSEIRLRASGDQEAGRSILSVTYEVVGRSADGTLPTTLARRIAEVHGGALEVSDLEDARQQISVALPGG